MPPGRRSSTRPSASAISTDAMRLPTTTSNGPSPLGELPSRARMRRASPLRFALALVASTAIGSMSSASTRPAPSRTAAIERIPDPEPTSSTRAAAVSVARRQRSAMDSSAARHSRVVGWSPVPNAIPGSSAITTSPGSRWWSPPRRADHDPAADPHHREVRLPRVRPIGLLHDACLELADRPQPEGLEVAEVTLRSAPPRRARPRRRATGGGRARAPVGRGPRAPPGPSSTSSNAGSTLVPPGAALDRISDTDSTASWSAAIESSSQLPGEEAAASRSRPASGSVMDGTCPSLTPGPASRGSRRAMRRPPRPRPRTARAARAGAW